MDMLVHTFDSRHAIHERLVGLEPAYEIHGLLGDQTHQPLSGEPLLQANPNIHTKKIDGNLLLFGHGIA
jgi:hypothetical protein